MTNHRTITSDCLLDFGFIKEDDSTYVHVNGRWTVVDDKEGEWIVTISFFSDNQSQFAHFNIQYIYQLVNIIEFFNTW